MNKEMFTTGTDDWGTPQSLFDYLNEIHNFTLDACASDYNYKMKPYFTEEDDSLKQTWFGNVWCNPPYSKQLQKQFIEKAVSEIKLGNCDRVVMLIPARTDTANFHELIVPNASEILFIKGRISFNKQGKGSESAPFPSMIVIFEKNKSSVLMSTIEDLPRKD